MGRHVLTACSKEHKPYSDASAKMHTALNTNPELQASAEAVKKGKGLAVTQRQVSLSVHDCGD